MTKTTHAVYEETSGWPAWVTLLVWGSAFLVALSAYRSGLGPGVGWAVLLVPVSLHLLFGRLTVRVTRTYVTATFGSLGLFRRRVPFADIERLEVVEYRPLIDFGGWGVRRRPGREAWTIRGNRALELELTDGTDLYLGSDTPERLLEELQIAGHHHWDDPE